MNERKVIPLNDIIEVVQKDLVRADEETQTQKTEIVDSETAEPKDKEVKADEVKADEVKTDDALENIEPKAKANDKEVKIDNEPKDEDIVGLDAELPKGEIESEIIDSDIVESDDKKRDEFLTQTREICDSADFGISVKIPHFENRETYRSAVYKFCKLNPKFVSDKYKNLRIDSLTNELCDEVKSSVFANIQSHKPKATQAKGQWIDTGRGYRVMVDF